MKADKTRALEITKDILILADKNQYHPDDLLASVTSLTLIISSKFQLSPDDFDMIVDDMKKEYRSRFLIGEKL